MKFEVRYTDRALADLERLYFHLIDRAVFFEDLAIADEALAAIQGEVERLSTSPFICRKAEADSPLRELLIGFGRSGYVALFEIEDAATVTIHAVRHQREDDYR